jgi:hypothetical protein
VRVELHPEARAELRRGALWYDEQREGLGADFIAAVSSALDRIGRAPESFPPWPNLTSQTLLIRRSTLQRFPYVVAFEQHADYSLVLAIAMRSVVRSTGSRVPAHEQFVIMRFGVRQAI